MRRALPLILLTLSAPRLPAQEPAPPRTGDRVAVMHACADRRLSTGRVRRVCQEATGVVSRADMVSIELLVEHPSSQRDTLLRVALADLESLQLLPPAAFDQLRVGRSVRVAPRGGFRRQGKVAGWAGDTLLLASGLGQLRLPVTDLESVSLRGNAAKGAGVGAAVGFLPGFLFGFWFAGSYCGWGGPDDCGGMDDFFDFAPVGVVVGLVTAAPGALIGLAVGSAWREMPLDRPQATVGVSRGRLTFGATVSF